MIEERIIKPFWSRSAKLHLEFDPDVYEEPFYAISWDRSRNFDTGRSILKIPWKFDWNSKNKCITDKFRIILDECKEDFIKIPDTSQILSPIIIPDFFESPYKNFGSNIRSAMAVIYLPNELTSIIKSDKISGNLNQIKCHKDHIIYEKKVNVRSDTREILEFNEVYDYAIKVIKTLKGE